MALNNIVFVKGQGGLGRPLTGTDYFSGIVFYDNTLPSGFATNDRIKQIFSVEDAESLGILGTYNDETSATATVTITVSGNTGDLITITTKEGGNNGSRMVSGGTLVDATYVTKTLASYTKTATDTGTTVIAASVATAINLGYDTHGYSATSSSAIVTITAKKGLGTFPNTKALTLTFTGALAATSTAWTGGVASKNAIKHYHISEYFRLQPKGNLYVGIFAVPAGTYTFDEVALMSQYSLGTIKQLAIYQDGQAFNVNDITTIQNQCNLLDAAIAPLSVLFTSNFAAVVNLSTLADLGIYTGNKVSVILGEDAGGQGNQLSWANNNKTISVLGAALGAVSLAKVSEDIAWVSKFNLSSGSENETIGFANGVSINDASISANLISLLDLRRYIFMRKFINVAGSYFNDSHTAIARTSDYAYIENNRTIDKAIRGVYADLLPSLNGPLTLKANGTLEDGTLAYLESQASFSVNQMVRNTEISDVSVTIDPEQNVATTSTVIVAIQLVPIGVGRNIIVNIGFSAAI